MLPEYIEARHKVRDEMLEIINDLALANKSALQALEDADKDGLKKAKKPIKDILKRTEEIDNHIVLIFVKYAPEARDLRELIAYLKVTSVVNRIMVNIDNYIKNIQMFLDDNESEFYKIIKESLSINRFTLNAFDFILEMFQIFDDHERLETLAGKIEVEYSKTDDVYSLIEKEIIQKAVSSHSVAEEYFNLLKYIRKNIKVIERLDDISSKLIFAKIGGKL
jgi:phosphate transport system protein